MCAEFIENQSFDILSKNHSQMIKENLFFELDSNSPDLGFEASVLKCF